MSELCVEEFRKFFKTIRRCMSIIGTDTFKPDFQMGLLSKLSIFFIVTYFFHCAYTIYIKISSGFRIIVEVFATAGSVFQGASKMGNFILQRNELIGMRDFLEEIYLKYETKNDKYRSVFRNSMNIQKLYIYGWMYAFTLIISSLVIGPIGWLIITGQRIPILVFFVIGINEETDFGYFLLMAFHIYNLILDAAAIFGFDIMYYLYVSHSKLLKDILIVKFEELNDKNVECDGNINETLPLLKDVINWHQKYTDYIDRVAKCFYWVTFTQIFTTACSIILSMLSIFTGGWPMAYAYCSYSYLILWAYCSLGTIVEITNDEVCASIYNACIWYELSPKEQQMLKLMLLKAQNATVFNVGGIMPLSFSTGLQVTKGVYSFMMFFITFLDI